MSLAVLLAVRPVAAAETLVTELPGGATLSLVLIPAGTETGGRSHPRDGSTEQLTISRPFYLAQHELTQRQWESVMGTRPWAGRRYVNDHPDHPAVYISWHDVQDLITRLNSAAGDSLYRLPTETEWEYACRANTHTKWYSGDEEEALAVHAWFRKNLRKRHARQVGMRAPNTWGLYDMHGNVWEWVRDRFRPAHGSPTADHVNRGGSFYDPADRLRSDYRNHDHPAYQSADTGVRLLRNIP